MLKIVFVGIKHCGKSTFGKSLAKRWDCVFFDSDTELEKAFYQQSGSRCSCRDIFKILGEEKFREFESEVIRSLISGEQTVIALGGGAVSNPFVDVETLRQLGHIVWLDVADEIAYRRVERKGLPPFLAESADPFRSFCEMNRKRREEFSKVADTVFRMDTELEIPEAANLLAETLERKYK